MHRSLKRNLVLGLAALAVAAFAGGAYAATQNSGPNTRQAFLNDVAKRLHVTPSQLSSALNGAAIDQLQAEVKAGEITQAQANALEQRMKNGATVPLLPYAVPAPFLLAPGVPGLRGVPGVPGAKNAFPRPAFPGGGAYPAIPFGFRGPAFGLGLSAASSYLGVAVPQLLQQLQSGKSLAQIASSKGKTVAGLEQAMTAPIKKALAAAVSSKAITAAQEQKALSKYESVLGQWINHKGFSAGAPKLRGWFRGGPRGPYGPGFALPGGPGFALPGGATPPNGPHARKAPATPGALPQLFQPAPTA